ncbi:MAG TPA: type II secretion protein F [Clostridiales bacterium]|nr:type II secretion protein F [Clostridiales bacterium]
MAQYTYTAVDLAGKKYSGVLEANNKAQLIQKLREKGQFITDAEDKVDTAARDLASRAKKIKLKPLAVFCRQFATLINSGITAVKALDFLYQQTTDKNLRGCVGRVYEQVQKGESMSEAFRKQGQAFPELFINMVMTGESAGNLDQVLLRMADHYEKENKLRNKVKSAMIYPIVLASLTIVVVIVMLVFVLPTFTGIIVSGGGELPLITRILVGFSEFLQKYWWLVGGIIIGLVIAWRGFKRSEKGHLWWDSFKLKMPVVGKSLRMIVAARFARTLSTLISSGLQMLTSIEITARIVDNQLIYNKLMTVTEDIRKGSQLSVAIRKTEQFPAMIYNMISVGEESGLLDDILTKTAAFFDEESDAAIGRLVGLLEPLMIIIMAVVIGFIVIAMYLPMFQMYSFIA